MVIQEGSFTCDLLQAYGKPTKASYGTYFHQKLATFLRIISNQGERERKALLMRDSWMRLNIHRKIVVMKYNLAISHLFSLVEPRLILQFKESACTCCVFQSKDLQRCFKSILCPH